MVFKFLQEHNEIGILGFIIGIVQSFINYATPIVQFIGLIIGVGIGVLQLLISFRKYRQGKNQNDRHE